MKPQFEIRYKAEEWRSRVTAARAQSLAYVNGVECKILPAEIGAYFVALELKGKNCGIGLLANEPLECMLNHARKVIATWTGEDSRTSWAMALVLIGLILLNQIDAEVSGC